MRRAKNFVRQLDVIIVFVSSIISNIKGLADSADDEKLSDFDYQEYSEMGDDVYNFRDKTYLKYVNPLQLVDKDGNASPTNSMPELKKTGYIFDVILRKVIYSDFKLERMSTDSPDGLQRRCYRGVKNFREEVSAIIPLSEDFIMVDFEYNYNLGRDLRETMIFKRGKLDTTVNFPDKIKDDFKDLKPDQYDVYAAMSQHSKQ